VSDENVNVTHPTEAEKTPVVLNALQFVVVEGVGAVGTVEGVGAVGTVEGVGAVGTVE